MSPTDDQDADSEQAASDETAQRKHQDQLDTTLRKRLRTLAVVSIVLVAGLSTLAFLKPSSDTIAICVILPEEDVLFSHSPEIEMAMTMAVEELNEWGGIGNTRIELIIQETEVEPDAVASLFEHLEQDVQPIAYAAISCELLSLLSPLTDAAEVPLIGLASAPGLTEGYGWTYRYFVSPDHEANATLRVLDTLNVDSLGILYAPTPHGCGVSDLLIDGFTASGGTVEQQACALDDTDFDDEIEALMDTDAIFVVAHCPVMIAMFEALNERDYDGYLLASSCASSPRLRDMIPQDGYYASAPILYKAENILAIEFTEKFNENYAIPYSHHAAVGYDIVYIVHDLLEGHDLTREELGQQLDGGFVFSGVMGGMRVDPGSHDFPIPVYPVIVLEGELSYL